MAFQSLMHERNIYKERPDFAQIALQYPAFRKYALSDAKGKVHIDFSNHDALRTLTKILLEKDFNLKVEIPKGFLIPTVPQRLNYILWIEDLLTNLHDRNEIPHGIDIGCGPCAIFSILGAKKNGWKFTATETSNDAFQWAKKNISDNDLSSFISVVKVSPNYTLNEVLSSSENVYDFCLCNPPFYENVDEIRKKNTKAKGTIAMMAKKEEIVAEGGEVAFVKKIIDESFIFKNRIRLYTSMFGKKKSFLEILNVLQHTEDVTFTKSQFCQGNTIRWSIAWTFCKSVSFKKAEIPKPKKSKKVKPPLIYQIPKSLQSVNYNVQEISKCIWGILEDAKIAVKVIRSHQHYTESQISSNQNTWSHQRRKRRELKRNTFNNDNLMQNIPEKSTIETGKIISPSSLEDTSLSFLLGQQPLTESNYLPDEEKETCVQTKNQTSPIHTESMSLKRKISNDYPDSNKKFHLDMTLPNDTDDTSSTNLPLMTSDVPISLKPYSSTKSIKYESNYNEATNDVHICSNIDSHSVASLESKMEQGSALCTEGMSRKRKMSNDYPDSNKKFNLDTILLNDADDSSSTNAPSITIDVPISLKPSSSTESIKYDSNYNEATNKVNTCSNIDSHCVATHESKKEQAVLLKASSDSLTADHIELKKEIKHILKNKKERNDEGEKMPDEFQEKILLFCILKIRKAKDNNILLEINCPPDANRDSLYQIFQFLKNKLK